MSGDVRAGTEGGTLAGLEALRDRLALSLVEEGTSRHQVPALAARLVKLLEAIEAERVGPAGRRSGGRRGGTNFGRTGRGSGLGESPVSDAGPVPDDLRDAVRAGYRPGLIAVRRLLAGLLDRPDLAGRIVATAARTLAEVIARVDSLPDPDEPPSKCDVLREQRDARLGAARDELASFLSADHADA